MKIVGLVTEYNPFHNGHKYHIDKALEISGADAAVVVMSGDYVQRGAPALLPKHLRAEMALRCGASVIFELPVCYATGSAEFFARGAVSLFHELGCVDSICFGSECGDLSLLNEIATILSDEPDEFKMLLQSYLKKGLSFPQARHKALTDYTDNPLLADILGKPNNILAIEYLKAIRHFNSRLTPYTILRVGSAYHEEALHESYSSASAIRNSFVQNNHIPDILHSQIPDNAFSVLQKNYQKRYPVTVDDFSLLLKYKLLTENTDSLLRYADMTTDLANRIIKKRNDLLSWTQFCNILKTKEITYSRISRILLHILLDITETDTKAHYARILGFAKKDAGLLSIMKSSSSIPLITKLGNPYTLSDKGSTMLQQDIFSSDLYESVVTEKFGRNFLNEYQKQIILI